MVRYELVIWTGAVVRRTKGTIALVAVVLLCASCTSTTGPTDSLPAPTTSRSGGEAKETVTNLPSPGPSTSSDVADEASLISAVGIAEAVMREFVAHDRSYDQWWAGVSPYLDPVALSDYAYTDPRTVPASAVTGAGVVSAAPSSTHVTVLVPTDAGQYRVELFRQSQDASWLVSSMTPSSSG